MAVTAENNCFGQFTVRGKYFRKSFGSNSAENYGRYKGRKLFRSHTTNTGLMKTYEIIRITVQFSLDKTAKP